jgi:hypothetical protein
MAVIQPQYSVTTAIACTMSTLAASSARGSDAVYNTSTLYDDAILHIEVQTNSSAPVDLKACQIFLYSSLDGVAWSGSRTENVSTDIAVTLDSPTNLVLADTMNTPAASTIYRNEISVAQAIGFMPAAWGYVISNRNGFPLNTTAANLSASYAGVTFTVG